MLPSCTNQTLTLQANQPIAFIACSMGQSSLFPLCEATHHWCQVNVSSRSYSKEARKKQTLKSCNQKNEQNNSVMFQYFNLVSIF